MIWSFARSSATPSMYMLSIAASGSLYLYGRGDVSGEYPIGLHPVLFGSGYDDGAWHHAAITYDGSTDLNVYIDGAAQTPVVVGAGAMSPDILAVGARRSSSATSLPLLGSVADFSIFERVLDATELAKIATAPVLDYGALSPVLWSWMGDKDALADIRDHGSNNGAVTLTNGVAGDLQDGAPS